MKTSEVLRAAKRRLWGGKTAYAKMWYSGKFEYICHAIENSTGIPYYDRARCMRMIGYRLRPYNDAKIWLEKKAHIPYEELTLIKVQRWRRQWLDLLIAEYEAKGD